MIETARQPSPQPALDRALDELREGAQRWVALAPKDKASLLRDVRERVAQRAGTWAETAARAKGVAGTPLEGEEWISGPWALLYGLNRYIKTLESIAATGHPPLEPGSYRKRPDGQVTVDIFPATMWDRLLLSGVTGQVWMEPGVTLSALRESMGTWYREAQAKPKVALVLGAGNIAAIAPLDVLYKLIADGAVCMLKLNPVNAYLAPILEAALAPLIEGDYLRFADGGVDVGKYLCNHPNVDEIHITGSENTHDAIVFGDGDDAAQRKRENQPLLQKPITSELGNVSPTIVVPGPWTRDDFYFQAEHIVTQKMHNDGFNCIAAQVLILPQDWDGTPKLLGAIERVLSDINDRPAYYPGAAQRRSALVANHADSDRVFEAGSGDEGYTPRTLIHVDAIATNDPAFKTEAFSSVLAYTMLPGEVDAYLASAVAFANDELAGTLGANIIAHPTTLKASAVAVDRAIADLRYGCVGVNAWTGVGFLLAETTWGAFPGHTLDNVRSGIGVVHNSRLFSRAQKSVITAPFAPFPRSFASYEATLLPKPPWFVTHRTSAKVGKALCEFEVNQNIATAAKVAILAMQG